MSTEPKDIRWELRFANYRKALAKLSQAVRVVGTANDDSTLKSSDALQEMIREGLIHRFEYTHQLAWNVMKDYAEYQGAIELGGSRDATREAFKMGLIANAEVWMDIIKTETNRCIPITRRQPTKYTVRLLMPTTRSLSNLKSTCLRCTRVRKRIFLMLSYEVWVIRRNHNEHSASFSSSC